MNFNKMQWDLEKSKKPLDDYKDLKHALKYHLDNISIDIGKDSIVKYIVYVYHLGSPFVATVDNLNKRKAAVCYHLKLDIENEAVKMMCGNMDKNLCFAICKFLQLEGSDDWVSLIRIQEFLNKLDVEIIGMSEDDMKKQGDTLRGVIKDLEPERDKKKAIVFKGDLDVASNLNPFLLQEEARKVYPEDFK